MICALESTFAYGFLPSALAQTPETSAIFELEVNRARHGDVVVYLRDDDIWIPWQDLLDAGLKDFGGDREVIQGVEHVSLKSLAPDITFERDDTELVLRVQSVADFLGEDVFDLGSRVAPAGIIYSQPLSAYLNYGLQWQDFETLTAGTEVALSFGGNALYSAFSLAGDGSINRGLSNLTLDNRHSLTSLIIGDTQVSTDLLGGGTLLGGISWGRNFGLSPYLVRQPAFNVSGVAETPSQAEVYVNNRLVRTLEVPPGPFRLTNLPQSGGFNRVRVVVRGLDGQEQIFDSGFVQFASLLEPGLAEFNVAFGFERQGLGQDSFSYDNDWRFLAHYRRGLLSNVTAGARIEASPQVISGGLTASTALPVGTLDLAGAFSSANDVKGSAAAIAYTYPGNFLSFSGGVRLQSPHYANTSLDPSRDRPLLQSFVSARVPLGSRASLSGQYNLTNPRDQGINDRISVQSQIRVAPNVNLFLQAARSQFQPNAPVNEFSIGLNYFLGNSTSLNAGWRQRGDEGVPTLSVQRSLPPGEGYGYRVELEQQGDQSRAATSFSYNTPWSRYQLGYTQSGDIGSNLLVAEGGIVAIGGEVYATRPVQGSFALIQVPDSPNVRGYLSNQEIGRTNRRGSLLVPSLLPYFGNQLSINDQDIDLDFDVGETSQLIAPPFRGGSIARFNVRRVQNIIGTVTLEKAGESIIPSYGQLIIRVGDRREVSPLTRTGEFYFDNIDAGVYTAEVAYQEDICTFEITIPESDELFITLDPLVCRSTKS